jgi:hypothetical protein
LGRSGITEALTSRENSEIKMSNKVLYPYFFDFWVTKNFTIIAFLESKNSKVIVKKGR